MPRFPLALAVASVFCLSASADDLDVARQALRDGLWEVARVHAAKAEGPEARLVTVESYAREGKWEEVLKNLDSEREAVGDGAAYYRALALLRLGRPAEASAALAEYATAVKPVKPDGEDAYESRFLLLRAEIARASGRAKEVIALAGEQGYPHDDVDAVMTLAWAKSEDGDKAGAERLWRAVVASTNVSDSALASAATNLGDVASLRNAQGRIESAPLKRAVGLRLGVKLIASDETFDEGADAIRFLAKDAPDADGAKAAFLLLADALSKRDRNQEAAEAYRAALEAWPEAARETAVHEGLAWALRKLGKTEESLDAFARAETVAESETDRARTLLEQGDVLASAGRGDEAMSKYRTVLAKYPETPSGRKLKVVVELRDLESKGRALYRNFHFGEAQQAFSELARRDPARAPRMSYLEVLCLYGQGRDDEAAQAARKLAAGSSDPDVRAEATLWLAKFCYNARSWQESCNLFETYATNLVPSSVQAPSALVWAARAAFAARDHQRAISIVTTLATSYPDSPEKASGWLVQGEALVELARLDEAILVFGRLVLMEDAPAQTRFRARVLKTDVLFVMGADSPVRYREALDGYRELLQGESLTPDERLSLSFKVARTLEKLGRTEEATDQYYAEVVCAYRDGRERGVVYDEESAATFARAAFRLADEFERRGEGRRAGNMLRLVVRSDVVSAADEARRRLERLKRKGSL